MDNQGSVKKTLDMGLLLVLSGLLLLSSAAASPASKVGSVLLVSLIS
jgi:hypothetical protein